MKGSYIYKRGAMVPLLHGLWVHISLWWHQRPGSVHAHRCLECHHVVVCTCATRSRYNLAGCPWCTWPWALVWRSQGRKPKVKRRRKVAA